ncbi:MAG: lamin tail domain-containing protein [Chloroflexota bacterium]|nr:lamin tail domain-containing protein [Chloroflexota bacterium]
MKRIYTEMHIYLRGFTGLLTVFIIGCTSPANHVLVFESSPTPNISPTATIQRHIKVNTPIPTVATLAPGQSDYIAPIPTPSTSSNPKLQVTEGLTPIVESILSDTVASVDSSINKETEVRSTPTIKPEPAGDTIPTATPWPKCDQYSLPMTVTGKTLSDSVSAWLGDIMLAETSNFILNYLLSVPVCDSEGNSLLGLKFQVKTTDDLVIPGIISNGARYYSWNLMRELVPPTLSPSPTPATSAAIMVTAPNISEIPGDIPDYDRDTWSHWSDVNGDCQNTRHEVLISESLDPVSFNTNDSCSVATGRWLDQYTGVEVTEASALDVDHMIPLQNAHISGGWQWGASKRKDFANYLEYENHLIAVTASANRQKGSRPPDQWKPGLASYWCQYSLDWVNIKLEWGLSVTAAEWNSLQEMLSTCSTPITYSGTTATSTPTATPTPIAPTPTSNAQGTIQISSVSCNGQPEIIYVENVGSQTVELTGWRIEDEGPKYTMDFPSGFSIGAGSTIQVHSAASGEDTDTILFWTGRYVLNNNSDTAYLFDDSGTIVSQEAC